MEITRKCAVCKELIAINGADRNNCIYFKKAWYHKKCFLDYGNKMSRKKKGTKWAQAVSDYTNLCKKTEQYIHDTDIKDRIYRHMLEYYHMTFVPDYIFVKLNSIYDGTMKGLAQPIPPEHLLDMWKRKQKWLDNHYKKQKKQINGMQRICYDLSVLAGKYGDYLAWIDKRNNEAQKVKDRINSEIRIDYNRIPTQTNKSDVEDINALIDEIF